LDLEFIEQDEKTITLKELFGPKPSVWQFRHIPRRRWTNLLSHNYLGCSLFCPSLSKQSGKKEMYKLYYFTQRALNISRNTIY
jgi:hypothetical protein